jgi:O-antigen ligase
MQSNGDLTFGLHQKIIDKQSNERIFLSAMFLLVYLSYGAIGRDVFFNHNMATNAAIEDPIGAVLPFVRAAACFAAIFVVVASSGLTWAFSKVPLMFTPFVCLALASALWAAEPKDPIRSGLTLAFAWVAMPMLIHRLGVVYAVRLSLHLIAVVCILSALLAVFIPSIGTHTGLEVTEQAHAGRWRGIFAHKNALGPWAAYGSAFLFMHASLLKNVFQPYLWLAQICAVVCLFMSGSSTSLLLALFLYAGWAALMMLRRYPFKLVATVCLLGLAMVAAAAVGFQEQLFGIIGRDATLSGRTDIWALALDYIDARKWLGYGFGTLGGEDFLQRENIVFLQPIPGPESGYFTLILETGIVGAVLFFVPFFAAVRNGFEWLKYVKLEDRTAMEFLLLVLVSTLLEACTESNSLVSTGYDGVIAFTAFFALMTTPKSPEGAYRSDFRLAKYWTKPESSTGAAPSGLGA